MAKKLIKNTNTVLFGKKAFFCLVLFVLAVFGFSCSRQKSIPDILKKVRPTVVTISTFDRNGTALHQGSGFFIKPDQIISNWHVLEGANRVEIKTADGEIYVIKGVTAENEESDLIQLILEIPHPTIKALKFANTLPQEGERIVVVGSPLGLEQTISDGIVASIRDIPSFGKILQITAPISLGSSGSPVVNLEGKVVGVATMQFREGQNLNFAIPIQKVVSLEKGTFQTLAQWALSQINNLSLTGQTLLKTGDYEKALQCFKEVLDQYPEKEDAWFYLGYSYYKLRRPLEAMRAFKRAPNYVNSDAEVQFFLGGCYPCEESIKFYKQAILLKPDFAEAHYFLGERYVNCWFNYVSGDKDAALREYKILKTLDQKLADDLWRIIYH